MESSLGTRIAAPPLIMSPVPLAKFVPRFKLALASCVGFGKWSPRGAQAQGAAADKSKSQPPPAETGTTPAAEAAAPPPAAAAPPPAAAAPPPAAAAPPPAAAVPPPAAAAPPPAEVAPPPEVSPRLELRSKLLAAAPNLANAAQSHRRNVATLR